MTFITLVRRPPSPSDLTPSSGVRSGAEAPTLTSNGRCLFQPMPLWCRVVRVPATGDLAILVEEGSCVFCHLCYINSGYLCDAFDAALRNQPQSRKVNSSDLFNFALQGPRIMSGKWTGRPRDERA
jgi:hypothetical protein